MDSARAANRRPSPVLALLLTGTLSAFPFATPLGRAALTIVAAAMTLAAWHALDRATPRLGVFASVFLLSSLVGSRYSQLSFGLTILLYLLAVRRVPRLRGDQAWLRWGKFGVLVQASCIVVAAAAAVALLVWHAVSAGDCQSAHVGTGAWRMAGSVLP